jgi:hypothetical protein
MQWQSVCLSAMRISQGYFLEFPGVQSQRRRFPFSLFTWEMDVVYLGVKTIIPSLRTPAVKEPTLFLHISPQTWLLPWFVNLLQRAHKKSLTVFTFSFVCPGGHLPGTHVFALGYCKAGCWVGWEEALSGQQVAQEHFPGLCRCYSPSAFPDLLRESGNAGLKGATELRFSTKAGFCP